MILHSWWYCYATIIIMSVKKTPPPPLRESGERDTLARNVPSKWTSSGVDEPEIKKDFLVKRNRKELQL